MIAILSLCLSLLSSLDTIAPHPIKIGIAGLSHDHVNWVFNEDHKKDIEIVGIAEADSVLVQKYADRYGFSMDLVFDELEGMVESVSPQAVTSFGSIYSHLDVVRICAPRGIH